MTRLNPATPDNIKQAMTDAGLTIVPFSADLVMLVSNALDSASDWLCGCDHYAFPSWAAAGKWLRSKDFPTGVEEITFRDRREA
jgi:hypothetical protein